MSMTRKDFLEIAGSSTVLLFLQACGGGGSDSPAPAPQGQSCGSTGSAIAGNHGHALTIARADLDSTVNMTYDITGSAGHPHSVTFTPAQLQALKAGQNVQVTSTNNAAHDHVVTANCA